MTHPRPEVKGRRGFWRPPPPATLEEIRAKTPSIPALPSDSARPHWSIMIPTYNSGRYLRRTLETVLAEDCGPSYMHIEVVDACSTTDDPERVVRDVGGKRIGFHRMEVNRGPSHTFNVCIERSRGRLVHILHGDDMVRPRFYEAYSKIAKRYPKAGMIVGQAVLVDEHDRWTGVFGRKPPPGGGVLDDFIEGETVQNLLRFPAVVVRREAYEQVGGFCTLFDHVSDWDMWFRLAQVGDVVSVSEPMACYRHHADCYSAQRLQTTTNVQESHSIILANLARRGDESSRNGGEWRARLGNLAEATAWRLDGQGSLDGRYRHALWAWWLAPSVRRTNFLVKSWLKLKLRTVRSGPGAGGA